MAENTKSSRRPATAGASAARKVSSGRMVTTAEARAAAKTRVTLDKKLGRQTPDWVEKLASGR